MVGFDGLPPCLRNTLVGSWVVSSYWLQRESWQLRTVYLSHLKEYLHQQFVSYLGNHLEIVAVGWFHRCWEHENVLVFGCGD